MKANIINNRSSNSAIALALYEGFTDERKKEIGKQIYIEQVPDALEKIAMNNDAIIFDILIEEFEFDKYDCRRLWDKLEQRRADYVKEVQISSGVEQNDIAADKLKRYAGVDIELWRTQKTDWKAERDKVWMDNEAEIAQI